LPHMYMLAPTFWSTTVARRFEYDLSMLQPA